MAKPSLNPIRGFRDLYPDEKATQEYLFAKIRNIADNYGFVSYDGPILEPIDIYLEKTSEELIKRQTYQVIDKNGDVLVMRPEITPSMARMVAARARELTFPLRLFNNGQRFRYEAPQKGRGREFYQQDFDILGPADVVADAEILAVAISVMTELGVTSDDFVVYLNSRSEMEKNLAQLGFTTAQYPKLLDAIDRQDKIDSSEFKKLLTNIEPDEKKIEKLTELLKNQSEEKSEYFAALFSLLKNLKIDKYCQINYNITRGLDYYTGLVFEVKMQGGELTRSLFGGGRYDNLVASYDSKYQIPGVGFATSDVVLLEFLKEKNLLPQINPRQTKVLVTIFNNDLAGESASCAQMLREAFIATELYPDATKPLDKQLKYADKVQIPYVAIVGPEEKEKGIVNLKNLKTGEQEKLALVDLIKKLTS